MQSLGKFFHDKFGNDTKLKKKAIEAIYEKLSQIEGIELVIADLLDVGEEDIAIVGRSLDPYTYGMLEGKRHLARYFRSKFEKLSTKKVS